MLLSDRDILTEVEAGRIALDPWDPDMIQPSSVDVRLDKYFRVFENHRYPHIDPADGREAEDPVRLFIVQHESDFVHMRGDHDARRAGLFRFFHGDQVP